MEYITKDTHLDFSEDGTNFKELYGLNSFPNMGGQPERQEVTNMRDKSKRYINGLQDLDNLEFGFFYNNEKTEDTTIIKKAFSKLKALETDDTLLDWRLIFPDGSSYSWKGKPVVYINSGAPGEPLKFTLNISCESAMSYTEGTVSD